jgi:hypothetical protein
MVVQENCIIIFENLNELNAYYFLINMALVHMPMNNKLKILDNLNVNLFLLNDKKMKGQHQDQVLMIEIYY